MWTVGLTTDSENKAAFSNSSGVGSTDGAYN